MEYVNYDKYLSEFETSLYERELRRSKQLLEDYQDFKQVIVPAMKQYSALCINKNLKRTIQGVLLMCEIGETKLKPICDGTKKSTAEELITMNKNFSKSMELIQKKYEQIVTKEIPELNEGEGFGL